MNRIRLVQGDITKLEVDAIVNAANRLMLGGLGVDGAIHDAAGPELLRACAEIPEVTLGIRCPTGEARITPGFRLPARYVIHTVGPIWHGGGVREPELLASCYQSTLKLARQHGCRTVAFPAISCGVYLYPPELACAIAVREITAELSMNPSFEEITLVAFNSDMHQVFQSAMAAHR